MITILGATGFVGSALVTALQETGDEVCGLSRPEFVLEDSSTFSSIPDKTEILIHSAGPAGTEHSEEKYWKECVQSAHKLVEFINRERTGIKLILYISSGAVYKPTQNILTETSELGPTNLYGLSRMLCENILMHTAGCITAIARLFFPYGPGQRIPRLIPSLTQRIRENEIVTLNDEQGSPLINPIYIKDLTDSLIKIMRNPDPKIYNVGGCENVSIKQLAQTIGDELGISPVFSINNTQSSNVYCSPRFKCKTVLTEGIRATIINEDPNG